MVECGAKISQKLPHIRCRVSRATVVFHAILIIKNGYHFEDFYVLPQNRDLLFTSGLFFQDNHCPKICQLKFAGCSTESSFFFSLLNNGLLQRRSDRGFFLSSRNARSHKGELRDNKRRLIVFIWGLLRPVYKYAISLSSKTHRSLHTTVLMCFRLSGTLKSSTMVELNAVTLVEL